MLKVFFSKLIYLLFYLMSNKKNDSCNAVSTWLAAYRISRKAIIKLAPSPMGRRDGIVF